MPDDFCCEHGYEFMKCGKVWGAVPYCEACDDARAAAIFAMSPEEWKREKAIAEQLNAASPADQQ